MKTKSLDTSPITSNTQSFGESSISAFQKALNQAKNLTPEDARASDLAWRKFADSARADVQDIKDIAPKMQNGVVVMGGSGADRHEEAGLLAIDLGVGLADRGRTIRTTDRSGAIASLAMVAKLLNPKLRIEAIDFDGVQDHPADLVWQPRTREIGKRVMMSKADAYILLPGSQESVWELAQIWTLVRAGKTSDRPIILVGSESCWNDFLQPYIQLALKSKTIKPSYLNHLHFAPTAEKALQLLDELAPIQKDDGEQQKKLDAFAVNALSDLNTLPPLMKKFDYSAVVYGGARLSEDHPEYKMCVAYSRGCKARIRSGGGPGIMEACSKGGSQNGRITEGINIELKPEQFLNAYVDVKHAAEAKTLEVRERFIMEKDSSHAFFSGGTGTLVEIFQLWSLMAAGKKARRPIMMSEYYRPTIEPFMKKALEEGYLDPETASYITFHDNAEDMIAIANTAYDALVPSKNSEE